MRRQISSSSFAYSRNCIEIAHRYSRHSHAQVTKGRYTEKDVSAVVACQGKDSESSATILGAAGAVRAQRNMEPCDNKGFACGPRGKLLAPAM